MGLEGSGKGSPLYLVWIEEFIDMEAVDNDLGLNILARAHKPSANIPLGQLYEAWTQ